MVRHHRNQTTENGENGHVKHAEGNGTVSTTTEKKLNSNGVSNATTTTNNTHFVKRVVSIPLVKDGVSTAHAIANKTSLGRFALSKANATYTSVTNYASNNQSIQTYYTSYLQPQLEKVDTLGCKSLDIIQEKVPLINKPTTDIYQNVVRDPLDGVKIRLDSTLSTVAHPAHLVIQETNKRLGVVVDGLEGAVDRYLPATTENNREINYDDNKKQSPTTSSGNQVVRVYGVLNEASRRITQRVTDQVQKTGIPTTRDELTRLAENNSIVQNVAQQIRLLQETLIQSITVYGNAAQEHLPASVTVRIQQTTVMINHLTNSVQQQLNGLVEKLKQQPDWIKLKLNNVITATYEQLELMKQEWNNRQDMNTVDKLKHVSKHIQNQIVPLLQQASSQLVAYSEIVRQKAQHELNAPHHYFGLLNQNTKTTQ